METTSTAHPASASPWTPPKIILLITLLVAAGFILWFAASVVLLIFLGVLLAILLHFLTCLLRDHTPLSHGWSLGIVLLLVLLLVAMFLGLAGAHIAAESDNLTSQLQKSWGQLNERFGQYQWAQQLTSQPKKGYLSQIPQGTFGRITKAFGATFGVMSSALLVVFVAIFSAADPGLYRRGLVHLVPIRHRERAQEVLDDAAVSLRWWIIGQLFSMTVVGTATAIGLWLLGIPFFITLGIFAGLLTFIPNFGPILSAVPAILLGLTSGPLTALYVVLLYMGIQAVESNLLTPLVQQRNVHLPPVLNVGTQVILGVLVGIPGLILAAPLAVLGMVLVKRLYVEDTLGDQLEKPS